MKIVNGGKPEPLTYAQLSVGEPCWYAGMLYMKVGGDCLGMVCLETGTFTRDSNVCAGTQFTKANAEIMVK